MAQCSRCLIPHECPGEDHKDCIRRLNEKTVLNKWDKRFLALSAHISTWSKDPSTQVGAVLVDEQRRVVAHGYNGFPRGVADDKERYADRSVKYEMVVHAEMNAILNANAPTAGTTLYATFFPCPNCAAMLIQAGIKRVVALPCSSDERYIERRKISETMFNEAGVRVG